MSLNWDLGSIKDHKTYCWLDDGKDKDGKPLYKLTGLTETFIWLTMIVGISEITDKNAQEFFTRVSFEENLLGPMRKHKNGKGVYVTFEDVKRHIGLRTNASPYTKSKWLSKVYKQWDDRTTRMLKAEEAKAS